MTYINLQEDKIDNLEDLEFLPKTIDLSDNFEGEEITLFQYTSSSGLKGMIEKHELWATNLAFMNDHKEMKYCLEIFDKILSSKLDQYQGNDDYNLNDFLQKLLKVVREKDTTCIYARCFTTKKDDLSQWRGYGNYSIGFNAKDLVIHSFTYTEQTKNLPLYLYKIIYDKIAQETMVDQMVEGIIDEYRKLSCRRKSVLGLENLDLIHTESIMNKIITDIFVNNLEKFIVCFKHQGFQEEEEIRLVYFDFLNTLPIEFRQSGEVFVPYVKLTHKCQKLPFKEIDVSPIFKDDFNRIETGLRLLLEKHKYFNIKINPSLIPYRH
jgi:hypothetical protein